MLCHCATGFIAKVEAKRRGDHHIQDQPARITVPSVESKAALPLPQCPPDLPLLEPAPHVAEPPESIRGRRGTVGPELSRE
jgi:hypothetical protein